MTKPVNADIMSVIFTFLRFYDKHSFKRTSQRNNKNKITICETRQLENSRDEILINYPHITEINISTNDHITNLNHMTNLKKLYIYYDSLGDDAIKNLTNVEELDVSNNLNVTSLNHMTKLKHLTIVSETSLTDEGLKNLTNLTYLNISRNGTLKYINQMTELIELYIDRTNIQNEGILNLTKVKILDISYNFNVRYLNHLTNLKILHVSGKCEVDDKDMNKLTELRELAMYDNKKITDINSLKKLRKLYAKRSMLTDEGINELTELDVLAIDDKTKFKSLKNFKRIKRLDCPEDTIPKDFGIECHVDEVEDSFFRPGRKHVQQLSLLHD